MKRASDACVWLSDRLTTFRHISDDTEAELLGFVYDFWTEHKKAPSLKILQEILERKTVSPLGPERLETYAQQQEELRLHSSEDLVEVLSDLIEEYETARVTEVLKAAKLINTGSMTDKKTKITLSGPKDAIKYLFQQVDRGTLGAGRQVTSGCLNTDAQDLEELYEKNKRDNLSGQSRIYTNISGIDSHIPIKRGDFVGILGYAGQRKSGLLRTMVYNAVLNGSNALHITLEQTYAEELTIYGLIHSHHRKWGKEFEIDRRKFDDGLLSKEESAFLFGVVIPDLINLPGKLIIRQPLEGTSWGAMKTTAEITNQTTELDLVAIDYLTLVSTKTGKREEMDENIKDAKQFALQFNEGKGCVLLTPVQGNRAGYDAATKQEGKWSPTGIYTFSEFEKSLDTLLTVYMDEDEKERTHIRIGSCKTRRSAGVPLFEAGVNCHAGYITDLNVIDMPTDPRVTKAFDEHYTG